MLRNSLNLNQFVKFAGQILFLAGLTCLLSVSQSQARNQAKADTPAESVTVLADPSLTIPLTLIAREYAKDYQIPISTEFAPSNEQIRRIEEGAEANVFIAAKQKWVGQLQSKGLMDVYSPVVIAHNELVLAAAKQYQPTLLLKKGLTAKDFEMPDAESDFSIALGDPEYTAEGTYALQSFSQLELEAELEPHYLFFRDIDQMIESIEKYHSYGVLFATDAQLHDTLHIVDRFAPYHHAPIEYKAVTVAGANMQGGRHFVDYLTSDKARAILGRFGFDTSL